MVDGQRIIDEEMAGLNAEYVRLHWDEEAISEKAVALAGATRAADSPCGADEVLEDVYDLHYPLLDEDMAALNQVGALCDRVLTQIALALTPDTLETEAEGLLLDAFARQGAACDVVFVGGEWRVFQYRHPVPKAVPIGRHVLLTPSVQLNGVHCNIARTIYFGDCLPKKIEDAHMAVCEASATSTALCEEGVSYRDIFQAYRQVLKKHGFEDQWRNHYPGGRTGYMVCQPHFSLNPDRRIGSREAYEWFATVPGAKAAELMIKDADRVYNASSAGHWPIGQVHANGKDITMANIMMR